ncbi:hypothetical protein E2562_026125 [Oryza meyeriana var. granulata]|uniref:Uncharacterized protein n=1 Tax=Oryza meyeriana var. granulata TaxID=110450 RepID=A0A6G1FCP8_9ORYZ|nr:hypothetical protein E2562_026125 [Oryza meyeriana var. granulata]
MELENWTAFARSPSCRRLLYRVQRNLGQGDRATPPPSHADTENHHILASLRIVVVSGTASPSSQASSPLSSLRLRPITVSSTLPQPGVWEMAYFLDKNRYYLACPDMSVHQY